MNMDYAVVFQTQQQIIQYECDEEGEGGWGCGGLLIAWYWWLPQQASTFWWQGNNPPPTPLKPPSSQPLSKTDAFFCRFCLLEYRGKSVQITSLPRIVTLTRGLRVWIKIYIKVKKTEYFLSLTLMSMMTMMMVVMLFKNKSYKNTMSRNQPIHCIKEIKSQ